MLRISLSEYKKCDGRFSSVTQKVVYHTCYILRWFLIIYLRIFFVSLPRRLYFFTCSERCFGRVLLCNQASVT